MAPRTLRGIHVFWMVAAFFAATVGVETLFIVRAVGTFPGEDAPNSYIQGLDYNSTLSRRSEERKLGWQAVAGVDDGSTLIVRMQGSDGEALGGLVVTAGVRKVGQSEDGQVVRLVEKNPGEYGAPLDVVGRGRFKLAIEARRPGEAVAAFEASKTLVLQ